MKAKLKKVKVTLKNVLDSSKAVELEALAIPELCSSMVRVPGKEIQDISKTKGLQLADTGLISSNGEQRISILIGSDNYWKVVSGKVERLKGSLMAIETLFGWCVQGPSGYGDLECLSVEVMKAIVEEDSVSQQLRAFWEIESLGIVESNTKLSAEDQGVLERFQDSIKFVGDKYEVSLPWKNDQKCLDNNYKIAERRLIKLAKKFQVDPAFFDRYQDILSEQEKMGIIETVDTRNEQVEKRDTFYLPHRAVIREDHESTKLRIVFDASSHEKDSLSLNDCLSPGPNLNPDLLTLLLKFRNKSIAFTSDIEKAFLQISISESDRDYVRFLWIPNLSRDEKDFQIETWRMTRVLFGVTSSPFLLAATIKHHVGKYESENPEVCKVLNSDLYVDDLISGADSIDEAVNIASKSKQILAAAGMNLRRWETNCRELRNLWEASDFDPTRESKFRKESSKSESQLKVLGLIWDPYSDKLKIDFKELVKFVQTNVNTKRAVLQALSRIYDPLGFLSPFTIRAKCLLQKIWELGLKWDEELPHAVFTLFNQWCSELELLQDFEINRYYFSFEPNEISSKQLHGFCDASEQAYGAVVYVRFLTSDGKLRASLVTAKTRVSPLKKITLPRLELMSALLVARIINQLKTVLQFNDSDIYLWTDSSITLHWIRGSANNWKQFVANRVSEIQCLTDPLRWSHCPGKENPADLVTRGKSAREIIESKMWLNGPEWLCEQEDSWPDGISKERELNAQTISSEMKQINKGSVQIGLSLDGSKSRECLVDINKFSSLSRMLRVTAWALRFVNNLKNSRQQRTGALNSIEITEAEKHWLKYVQATEFPEEVSKLLQQKQVSKTSPLISLNPVLDGDGLMCVGSRLQRSDLTARQINPWILPAKNKFTELEIKDCHEKMLHQGVSDTLIQLRERFWVLKGRQATKALINRCFVCKKLRVKPATETFAPLPCDRIKEAPPFEVVGIDFAGPLYVKTTTKREQQKSYILIITCAITRAVHLELVSSLSTENFLLAFKRFISRRGLCKTIYSDNAKTFKRASKDLANCWKLLKGEDCRKFFSEHRITWKFIVERSPWHGGFYERLIRSVKNCLKKVLGKALLSFEELLTVLTQCEAVLNSRPITYVHNDASELEPLTPSHFLIGKRVTTVPGGQASELSNTFSQNREQCTRRLKYRERLMNHLWRRWRDEYLLELRTAHHTPPRASHNIQIGDVILLKEEKVPRQMWKLGRIKTVTPGRDGKIRSCRIQLGSGKEITRSVQHVCPLEIGQNT